ncbi:hypothetical protein GCM10010172_52180 [Paractinoplanes ferrugineus]|uniref:Secreted protein n=1 Tax=Paractinoplanes ferrugineus TaxID=113564 RepID=A0A919J130_9ACTN|nr:hypothetical protein [Actinoplanes ferrugineus]GIE11963.1 hypothetical protein Afe05nite_38030 [Actinoplanes ferrugineus]
MKISSRIRPWRTVRRAVLGAVLSMGLIAGTATAAHASIWQLIDGFDYQPASTWQATASGASGSGFDINAGTARSAPNNAFLWAQTQFSSVGRSVVLRNNSSRITCGAAVYLQGLSGASVNVEVIDPSTWTYISLKNVTLNSSSYTMVTVPPWTGGPNTVYFRVSLLGKGGFSSIRADDATIQCTF